MPTAAGQLFGPLRPQALRFAELLATQGVTRGLLGPREAERVWDRHVLQGAVLAGLLPTGAPVLDVGSGAGLPGIPVALARPDLAVILLDSAARRVAFLQEAVAELGLDPRVGVRRGRVEELPRTERFAVVTARAVAPLARLAQWCRPRLTHDGRLFVLIGAAAREDAQRLGARLHRCGEDVLAEPVTIAELGRA